MDYLLKMVDLSMAMFGDDPQPPFASDPPGRGQPKNGEGNPGNLTWLPMVANLDSL
jgi:hypothetical protein